MTENDDGPIYQSHYEFIRRGVIKVEEFEGRAVGMRSEYLAYFYSPEFYLKKGLETPDPTRAAKLLLRAVALLQENS